MVNGVARHYWRDNAREAWWQYDATLGWRHKPNTAFRIRWPEADTGFINFDLNNLGFRETSKTQEDSQRRYRILVFGDSHTEGAVDTPDSIPNAAEAALNKMGIDSEVLNAGVGGYSLYQERLLFEEMLYLSPDVVVFVLYVGNDYKDILLQASPHLSIDSRGEVITHPPPPAAPETWINRLQRRSWAFQRARAVWNSSREDEFALTPLQRIAKTHRGVVWQSMDQADFFKRYPKRFQDSSTIHAHEVREIARSAAENNIELYFVILPSKYQIEPETNVSGFALGERLLDLDPHDKFEDRVRENFRAILDAQHIPYLDPYDRLIQSDRQLYWTSGHHLNIEGCAVIGELLAEDLMRCCIEPKK